MRKNKRFSEKPISNGSPIKLADLVTNNEIKLTAEEQEALTKINNLLNSKKHVVYELNLQIHKLESDLNTVILDSKNLQQELFNKASELAKTHGIDVDDPTKGKWNLDINTMTFTKIAVAP